MFPRLMLMRTVQTLLVAAALVVCLAPLHAQKLLQPVATALDVSGQVSVFDSDGGMERPVSAHLVIKQTQIIVTGADGWAKFQYTDGSTFEIFPKSKVVFQEHPANWEYLLNVWIGHVRVWIEHAPGVPNYKNVHTPTAVISVRGTIFSVDVPDEDTTVVSVEDGLVGVQNVTAPMGRIPLLTAGQSITVIRNQPLAVNQVNNLNQRVIHQLEDFVYRLVLQRRGAGGVGLPGSTGGSTGSAQGDKGKTTGTGTGTSTPTAPTAPTSGGTTTTSGHN